MGLSEIRSSLNPGAGVLILMRTTVSFWTHCPMLCRDSLSTENGIKNLLCTCMDRRQHLVTRITLFSGRHLKPTISICAIKICCQMCFIKCYTKLGQIAISFMIRSNILLDTATPMDSHGSSKLMRQYLHVKDLSSIRHRTQR